jgi:signal transduction histidine kinase
MTKNILELPKQIDLEQFLSAQSHDLKTPFNHIIGFSKIILKGQDGPLTDFQREDITTVYNSGVRSLNLISNLVEIARLSRGEKKASQMDTDMHMLVEQATAQWKKLNPTNEIQIDTKIACTNPTIRADEMQIRQLLSSSISIVAEYVERTGKIILSLEEENNCVIINVQSIGDKSKNPSELDLEMHGFLIQAYIDQQHGELRTHEVYDDGARIGFALPK